MPKIEIDGKEYVVDKEETIIKICDEIGKEVPRFCYHKNLKIAGNCRMCLVEVEGMPKLVPSCTQKIKDGMVIKTQSDKVKQVRQDVMSLMLINHPLDCPICDQGGECDLQDQALLYGKNYSDYECEKRAVKKKDFGPLISAHMTRCIHCTRCIRFLEDIAGSYEMGAIGRGEGVEIDTYIQRGIKSEISGNIIDLCPVGALNAKPTEFLVRSWELKKTKSIDISDATGTNIVLYARQNEIIKARPVSNAAINEEWMSDRGRFSVDALKYQRLDRPLVRSDRNKLEAVTWQQALSEVSYAVKGAGEELAVIAGEYADVESMCIAKRILNRLESSMHEFRQHDTDLVYDDRNLYHCHTSIADIETSDHCLLIGCNPRLEAPVMNIRIHRGVKAGKMSVYTLGLRTNLNYQHREIGNSPWILKQIAAGNHAYCEELKRAKRPLLIIGASALESDDGEAIMHYCKVIAEQYGFISDDWQGFNVMPHYASFVGGMKIGFIPELHMCNKSSPGVSKKGSIKRSEILRRAKTIILLGADNEDLRDIQKGCKVIYIGSHGDIGAAQADIVLPAAAFSEKSVTYVNLEGRAQRTSCAVKKPGEALAEYEILAKIMQMVFDDERVMKVSDIREMMKQQDEAFAEENLGVMIKVDLRTLVGRRRKGEKSVFNSDRIKNAFENDAEHYTHGTLGRLSPTMQRRAMDF